MPRMYGRLGWHGQCSCCNSNREKRAVKAGEERQWRAEAEEELNEHPDQYWLFLNP